MEMKPRVVPCTSTATPMVAGDSDVEVSSSGDEGVGIGGVIILISPEWMSRTRAQINKW